MTRATWVLAVAASATFAASMPADALAQGRSAVARQRPEQQQDERARERERLRAQRDAEARAAQARSTQARLGAEERERQARIQAAEDRRRELERERLRRERDGRYYDPRYDDRRYDDRRGRNDDRWDIWDRNNDRYDRNGGPPFCRSGQGHPVHGREWCRQKGYRLGADRWERSRWDDVFFRNTRYDDRTLGRSVLGDILGSVMLGRFESYGRQYSRDPLVGYWVPDARSRVLVLTVGDFPIARLIDLNRDGRVDNVYLWR